MNGTWYYALLLLVLSEDHQAKWNVHSEHVRLHFMSYGSEICSLSNRRLIFNEKYLAITTPACNPICHIRPVELVKKKLWQVFNWNVNCEGKTKRHPSVTSWDFGWKCALWHIWRLRLVICLFCRRYGGWIWHVIWILEAGVDGK